MVARESRCRAANREVEGGEEGPQKIARKMRERRASGDVGEEKHWIEQRERSIQRLEIVNRDGVRHHHCPVLVISYEAEQLHTSALEF